jgi:adhesin transport system outer membrane protein
MNNWGFPRTAGLLTSLLLGLASSAGATPGDKSLADVVTSALTSHPDIAEARHAWLARREEVRQAEGGFLPEVDLNAGIGYEYTDSPGTRATSNDGVDLTRQELGLNVRQMLFDGWGTANEVERQQARTDSAAARLLAVGESTAMHTVEAYLDLQRFRELNTIADESLQIHRRIEDQIRLRSEAGIGSRADYDQVESRVALAEVNLVAAEVNLRDAVTTFMRVVGSPPAGPYPPVTLPDEALPNTLDQALQLARAENPLLTVAAGDIAAAQAQHEAAKQFDYPRFDLEIGGNLDDDLDGIEGYNNDLSAMIRMRYNLYRGGADSARKRETAYNINEAKDVRDRTLRQLEESLRLAWAAQQATARQLPLLERQVEAARATRDAYAKQFNIGQRTLLDLLNAENEVQQARQSVVETRTDNLLARFRILEAMGALIDHFGAGEALADEG